MMAEKEPTGYNNEVKANKDRDPPRLRSIPFVEAEGNVMYQDQRLEFRVLCLSRYFLTDAAARGAALPYGGATNGAEILYLPRVLLVDVDSNKHVAFLNPKFDAVLTKHMLQVGSVMFVTQYVKRDPSHYKIKSFFFEIVGFGVQQITGDRYNLPRGVEETVELFETTPLPFSGLTKLHFWCDMVPRFPKSLSSSSQYCISASELTPHFENSRITTVSYVANSWAVDPEKSSSLLVRVLSKTKLSYYIPTRELKNFPAQSTFLVADKSGTCVVVMWDFANKEELYSRIHIGSVLYIKNYRAKRGIMPRFPYERDHPRRFPVELLVDYRSRVSRMTSVEDVMVVTIPPTYDVRDLNVVDEQYNFVTSGTERRMAGSSIIDVSGVVVGISRFYRVLPINLSVPGKTFVFRFIEIHDLRNDCFRQLEVFVNGQLDCHRNLSLGDSVIFTFMRVRTYDSLICKCTLTYLTSTQDTEMFVLRDGRHKVDSVGPYSATIVRELARLKVVRRKHPTWIGGFCLLSWVSVTGAILKEVTEGDLFSQGDFLVENLRNLVLRECKTFGLLGEIAKINYCTVHEMESDSLSRRISRISETVVEVFNNRNLSNVTSEAAQNNGLQLDTLPVRGGTELSRDIHETLWFPPTNVSDVPNPKNVIISDDLLCRNFFEIVIVPANKQIALSCVFVPPKPVGPMSDVTSKSLLNLLSMDYAVDGTRCGFPAYNDLKYSNAELDNLSRTSDEITQRQFTFILQAYKAGNDAVEILFCQIAHKTNESRSLQNN